MCPDTLCPGTGWLPVLIFLARERAAPKLQWFTSPVLHLRDDFKCSKHQVGLWTSSPSTVHTQLAMASQIQSYFNEEYMLKWVAYIPHWSRLVFKRQQVSLCPDTLCPGTGWLPVFHVSSDVVSRFHHEIIFNFQ